MSDAAGDWTLDARGLALTGALRVADAATPPRFQPMAARRVAPDVARTGRSPRPATWSSPTTATRVAGVAITHRLASGTGDARLTVPGHRLWRGIPTDRLTRLTFGVIADVRGYGARGGEGISWGAEGGDQHRHFHHRGHRSRRRPSARVTGRFRDDPLHRPARAGKRAGAGGDGGVDQSRRAGHRWAASSIRHCATTRVKVESGVWPSRGARWRSTRPCSISGGAAQARRLTFHVTGMDAGKFLQQFDFDNLNATGTFDGVLPMVFDDRGGRIEGGAADRARRWRRHRLSGRADRKGPSASGAIWRSSRCAR
ncbi:intermembrane phospholipid transport protein YdbH family protein [Sphingomonas adhaesiva]|uniref:intermembrane phospholipid transport protein YdbH family protein n=1 Tax=Sphingomonas adhaesiva TaxID=28212 RepID=UPI002FF77B38